MEHFASAFPILGPPLFDLVLVGVLGGLTAGLFGVGGSLVMTPALLWLYFREGLNPVFALQLAAGSSLAAEAVMLLLATWGRHLRDETHWPELFQIAPGMLLGGLIAGPVAPGHFGFLVRLGLGFALVMFGLAVAGGREPKSEKERRPPRIHPFWLNGPLAFLAGALGAYTGLGAALASLPLLGLALNLPARRLVGSVTALGFVFAIAGLSGYFPVGFAQDALPPGALEIIDSRAFSGICVGAALTVPLGVWLSGRLSPLRLRQSCGVLLMVGAGKLFWL